MRTLLLLTRCNRFRQMFFVEVCERFGFERGENRFGFGGAAAAGEPTRRFRKMPPKPPCQQRACTADQNNPAPTRHQEVSRHENASEQRCDRHGGESDDLRDGDVAPARTAGHDFADVRVDDDDFGADSGTGEKSQNNQPHRGRSERAGKRENGIKKQQRHKDDAASEAIAADAESDRADEHPEEARRDECGELWQRQEVRLLQRGADVSDDEDVVEVEEIAERYERDEAAVKSPQWKPFNACGDSGGGGVGVIHCGRFGG